MSIYGNYITSVISPITSQGASSQYSNILPESPFIYGSTGPGPLGVTGLYYPGDFTTGGKITALGSYLFPTTIYNSLPYIQYILTSQTIVINGDNTSYQSFRLNLSGNATVLNAVGLPVNGNYTIFIQPTTTVTINLNSGPVGGIPCRQNGSQTIGSSKFAIIDLKYDGNSYYAILTTF
jgi:hypothetical protein